MESLTQSHKILRFGVYEADLAAGELRKHGTRVKIQEQPFQILLVLLEHPGDLITRDVLRERLWANDTFVDFDSSLNTALTKLRTALCDSADNPRFIQTVPRQGYRFIAPVSSRMLEAMSPETEAAATALTQIPVPRADERSREVHNFSKAYALAAFALPISPISARRSVAVLAFKNLAADSSHA